MAAIPGAVVDGASLTERLRALTGVHGVALRHVTADSREVGSGSVFVAQPGDRHDGRAHIPQALAAGAAAVVWETRGSAWETQGPAAAAAWGVPHIPVTDLKGLLPDLAQVFYGDPSGRLRLIGVTGTNGKTSCSHWLAEALTALGQKTGVIGTLGWGFPGGLQAGARTTPDLLTVYRLLSELADAGAGAVAMEVSSHALDQGRVAGLRFDAAVLTNLSRDHLDYHGDMQTYAAAKARLFHTPGLRHAVLNLDDDFGRALAGELAGTGVSTWGYAVGPGAGHLNAEFLTAQHLNVSAGVYATAVRLSRRGVDLEVATASGRGRLQSPVLGAFNAHNLLAVLVTLLAGGHALDAALAALEEVRPVPGRMQTLGGGTAPLAVVDYAHTPDALEKALCALRPLAGDGRLVCVFGCGGERDRGKRPLMGEVAARLADRVVVTSDNPRSEDPRAIIRDILDALPSPTLVIEDRATAIYEAIALAKPGDIVLIAGKGHETTQDIAGVQYPFSDAEVATRALAALFPTPRGVRVPQEAWSPAADPDLTAPPAPPPGRGARVASE